MESECDNLTQEDGPSCAILVVGREDSFSPLLIDYALGLAFRMGYSIVALNLLEASRREMRRLNSAGGLKEQEALRTAAEKSMLNFQAKAKAGPRGVGFKWEWAMGEMEQVTRQVVEREGNIALVLTEPEYLDEKDRDNISIPTFFYAD